MFITTHQLAQKYNVTHVTAWRWVTQGKVKAVQVGKQWMVESQDLLGFHPEDFREPKKLRNKVICEARKEGTTLTFLANYYGISKARICYIAKHCKEA